MKPVIMFFEYLGDLKHLWAMFQWDPSIDSNIIEPSIQKCCNFCKSTEHGKLMVLNSNRRYYICSGDWVLLNSKTGILYGYTNDEVEKFFKLVDCTYGDYLERMNK